jgi:hypothetical protein
MKGRATVQCCQCCKPIVFGEGFVCFKAPGKQSYRFFHCRFRPGDCWDGHLIRGSNT